MGVPVLMVLLALLALVILVILVALLVLSVLLSIEAAGTMEPTTSRSHGLVSERSRNQRLGCHAC